MGGLKYVDTDEHRVGRRADGHGAVGEDDDGQVRQPVGVVDDVVESVVPTILLSSRLFPAVGRCKTPSGVRSP